jgi:hypothetical protein
MWIKIHSKYRDNVDIRDEVKRGDHDYLDIADEFVTIFGRPALYEFLDEKLEDDEYEPGKIHQLISRLDCEIITTNFDTLIERGYSTANKKINVVYRNDDMNNIKPPRILKINGCIKNARDQIIFNSKDFINFASKKPYIDTFIKHCFITNTVLFVGFSMDDLAFKIIHEWVRDKLIDPDAHRIAYSIQFSIDKNKKKFWDSQGIRFIELCPEGKLEDSEKSERLCTLFDYLSQRNIPDFKSGQIST